MTVLTWDTTDWVTVVFFSLILLAIAFYSLQYYCRNSDCDADDESALVDENENEACTDINDPPPPYSEFAVPARSVSRPPEWESHYVEPSPESEADLDRRISAFIIDIPNEAFAIAPPPTYAEALKVESQRRRPEVEVLENRENSAASRY